jgi:hypothetical protein
MLAHDLLPFSIGPFRKAQAQVDIGDATALIRKGVQAVTQSRTHPADRARRQQTPEEPENEYTESSHNK